MVAVAGRALPHPRTHRAIETQIGNVADLSIRSAVALITLPRTGDKWALELVDHIAQAAEDESVFAALSAAEAERAVRRAALDDAYRALSRIIEIGRANPETAARAEQVSDEDELGKRLETAIVDCKRLLIASLEAEDSIDPAPQATSAAVIAKDVATEMLRRVTRGA
jgi:hypothetical protein